MLIPQDMSNEDREEIMKIYNKFKQAKQKQGLEIAAREGQITAASNAETQQDLYHQLVDNSKANPKAKSKSSAKPMAKGKQVKSPGRHDTTTTGKQDMATTGKQDMATTGKQDMVTTGKQDMATTGKQDMATTGKQDMATTTTKRKRDR
jgi:hypothetical protein